MTVEESKIEIQDIIDIYEKEDMYPLLNDRQISALKVAISALQEQEAKAQLSREDTTSDCISRQDAIDALMEIMDRPNHADFLYTDEICKTLNDLPSAQPKIVRCKDCMHYGTYYRGNESKPVITYLCKWCLDRTMEPDDFCSRAERRTDEGD